MQPDGLRRELDLQHLPRRIYLRSCRFDGSADGVLQLDAFLTKDDLATGDSRHLEQVVDETNHLPELAFHHELGSISNVLILGEPQDLQTGPHRRQRIAQLVREGGQELVLAPIREP